ncbi:uncharacterized protein B0H18DRAFT_875471 [Fomitopsis serialis]|uniref:uncharacterized protein n=1 Tax=Fomitopsis serialis TaxID=139415 RepID=UPI002008B7BC|nr:uncharacterized protein B0H18DRAFT_875471 [Neoantrodia serialis]KAH9927632.1 hypothetical protein B0H18DRAFT_875471 [Neoantrodia serialis]
MATAQPIAFHANANDDVVMGTGSLTNQNGSFNPASYTRRLIGSPSLSWRGGSYGNMFFTGASPGQLLGPLDPNDFKFGKMSSSIESDRGSIVNALSAFERQDELCRDYTCCGLNLTDLHALVDHFEECHVVVVDPYAPPQPLPNATTPMPPHHQQSSYFPDANGVSVAPAYQGSFDPDDMEMEMDHPSAPSSGASSPPDTPVSTPLSSYPSGAFPGSHPGSQCPSPHPAPVSAFETTTVLPSRSGHSPLSVGFPSASRPMGGVQGRPEEAFNAYAGYSDYSALMPGTAASTSRSAAPNADGSAVADHNNAYRSTCVPPALLHHSASNSPAGTPASSRVASPALRNVTAAMASTSVSGATASGQTSSGSSSNTPRASTTLSRPATSLLLSKPFKCPKTNCNKSYKQANGLKYHMTHGSCNFAPPKDLEQIQALLESKRKEGNNEPMSDAELREVEREAERRLRPYACGVGDCQRRYKNMNGLRYHYQHSGDHGAIGLAMLASGQHECLQHSKSRHHTPSSNSHSTPASTAPSQNLRRSRRLRCRVRRQSPRTTPPLRCRRHTTALHGASTVPVDARAAVFAGAAAYMASM